MYGFEYITEDNVIMTSIFLYEWKIYRHFIQKFFKHNFENIKKCFFLPNCSHINLKKNTHGQSLFGILCTYK